MSLDNYEKFLEILQGDLDKIFAHQHEYIRCVPGCAHCCSSGEYPFSKLEFEYLMAGFEKLPSVIQKKISKKMETLKNSEAEEYACPFLINNLCSVYQNRGLTCRTFGLLSERADGTLTVPFCTNLGLNYAEVYDVDTKHVQIDLYKDLNYSKPPTLFRLNSRNIMGLAMCKELGLEFGEVKRLADWL